MEPNRCELQARSFAYAGHQQAVASSKHPAPVEQRPEYASGRANWPQVYPSNQQSLPQAAGPQTVKPEAATGSYAFAGYANYHHEPSYYEECKFYGHGANQQQQQHHAYEQHHNYQGYQPSGGQLHQAGSGQWAQPAFEGAQPGPNFGYYAACGYYQPSEAGGNQHLHHESGQQEMLFYRQREQYAPAEQPAASHHFNTFGSAQEPPAGYRANTSAGWHQAAGSAGQDNFGGWPPAAANPPAPLPVEPPVCKPSCFQAAPADSSSSNNNNQHNTNNHQNNTNNDNGQPKLCAQSGISPARTLRRVRPEVEVSRAKAAATRTNQCNVCGRLYARPSTLKTHLRTHTNERPFKCQVCSKTFSQAANLTAHQRVHTGERPFSCPICNRQFSQSSSVITHLRTHSGERPYRCAMCSRTFSDSSTLTKHCRIHSGEKPYQCDYCPLNFSQSGNLSRHLKLHLMSGGAAGALAKSAAAARQTETATSAGGLASSSSKLIIEAAAAKGPGPKAGSLIARRSGQFVNSKQSSLTSSASSGASSSSSTSSSGSASSSPLI